jgi:regulator of replication initiation timing
MIESLKDRIVETEADNDSLAVENEELRQFSLDGYAIAKNVKSLTADREELSVDLADKASTIRKLLDENESMQRRLREL